MARKIKEGLDYFELDCRLNQKFKLIEAEFGLKGFALIVKLWQQIYSQHGYYCEFSKDDKLLFLSELGGNSGADENLIDQVVTASIRRGIFSEDLYEKYQILTSRRIQEQYFNAVSRREIVEVEKAYLLLEVGEVLAYVSCALFFCLCLFDFLDGLFYLGIGLSEQLFGFFFGSLYDGFALGVYLVDVFFVALDGLLHLFLMLMDGLAFLFPVLFVAYDVLEVFVGTYVFLAYYF